MTEVLTDRRRDQLRDFLRTRRARLSPTDVGMAPGGRRRTPGLRREEVAVLAGVGVSWYTWLEQGRDIKVSGEVLDAVARALRLDPDERVHLYLLAGLNPPHGCGAEPVGRPQVTPELRHLLDAWSPRPAYVHDKYWNFVAMNDMARVVYQLETTDHNCLVTFFTSRRHREAHTAWEAAAPGVVARFRADAARLPADPEYARIIGDLSVVSPEFAALWARHEVRSASTMVKAVSHPLVGTLVFDATPLQLTDMPGYRLNLHNPHPGSGTEERLERLAHETGLG
jgi:transcriptional regulator with XRE-family HTH domain